MNLLSLIESKREGGEISPDQIRDLIKAVVSADVPDYQLAAFLMAVYFRGLTTEETTALTLAMRDSGEVLKFPKDPRPVVDKHSTGGVGDKVSLPLAPLIACLGFRVPMISGRGLGITGGTLDKLDSIPGYQTLLPAKRVVQLVQQVGCVICGQTDRMVPADKKLYALRDVTGTVPSIPLITASILSKKLAEGLDALILDVKWGRAAFMQSKAHAHALAKAMVTLGTQCGVNTRAMLTDMNTPIGRTAGNWLEVKESIACLENSQEAEDLRTLVIDCAAHLLVQTGKAKALAAARKQADASLRSGAPRRKWHEMIAAQGADLRAFNRKLARDQTAPVVAELKAPQSGYVTQCDARIIGEVIRDLGGGRMTQEAKINYDVGIDRLVKPGEPVKHGAALLRLHAARQSHVGPALERLREAFAISNGPPRQEKLIARIIN